MSSKSYAAIRQVCLIEDHQPYCRALQKSINRSSHLRCELTYPSLEAFVDGIPARAQVDVVLLDLGLPGMQGVAGIGLIQKHCPRAKILVLTVCTHKPVVLEALAAGANGYLLKADNLDTIIRSIDEILNGGAPLNSQIALMILTAFNVVRPSAPEADLTEREREMLSLLARGLIKKEIAEHLEISYHTVDFHVRNIYAKLKVHNLSGAVAKAIQLGLT